MKIGIVVVNYNSGKLLSDFLCRTFSDKSLNSKTKVVVVDNGSVDGSAMAAKTIFPSLELLAQKNNLGFAAGCNIGIKKVLIGKLEWVMVITPDIKISPQGIEELTKNKADIIGPILKFKRNGGWVRDYGGRFDFEKGKAFHNGQKGQAVDFVSGCCVAIRKCVFEKIGLFDERFFMYFEDVDFCLRAKKAGFKVIVDDKVEATHDLKDPNGRPLRQNLYLVKSGFLFLKKYYSGVTGSFFFLRWLLISFKLILKL